mgnify:CR=1 FL=1
MSRDTRIDVDRRVFLKAAAWSTIAATVALKACASPPEDSSGVMYDPSGLTEDLELFDLGVQSGLTSTGALLWTHRSTDASLQVRVWLEGGPLVLDEPVETEGAFIKVAVEELSPGARYGARGGCAGAASGGCDASGQLAPEVCWSRRQRASRRW